MAKRKRGAPKGSRNNPNGRPKDEPERQMTYVLTKWDIQRTFLKCISMTLAELQVMFDNPKSTSAEVIVAKILYEAARKGDHSKFESILTRAIGPVPKEVKIDATAHSEIMDYITDGDTDRTEKEALQ